MPIYTYQALKQGKEIVKGEVTASNLKDARDVIRKMGYVPTKITEYTDPSLKKIGRISALSLSEKIDFISTLRRVHSTNFGKTHQETEFKNYAAILRAKIKNKTT